MLFTVRDGILPYDFACQAAKAVYWNRYSNVTQYIDPVYHYRVWHECNKTGICNLYLCQNIGHNNSYTWDWNACAFSPVYYDNLGCVCEASISMFRNRYHSDWLNYGINLSFIIEILYLFVIAIKTSAYYNRAEEQHSICLLVIHLANYRTSMGV